MHDLSLEELREERDRLVRTSREIGGMMSPEEDQRMQLMLEVAALRALREIHLGRGASRKETPATPLLTLPRDPLQLTIVQRESKSIGGSSGTVRVRIGDITAGQVLVEVVPRSGPAFVDTVSMKPGDVVKFGVAQQVHYLTLTKLRNFLVGDDFAVFEVSAQAPSAKRLEALRKAAQPPAAPKGARNKGS
ncbi:MAG: hypothetical protein ISS72_10340 [Candidatus Brocadiae bacterium]|nr:hypothetical protein [Candidatus Brocadiia bacterium]